MTAEFTVLPAWWSKLGFCSAALIPVPGATAEVHTLMVFGPRRPTPGLARRAAEAAARAELATP